MLTYSAIPAIFVRYLSIHSVPSPIMNRLRVYQTEPPLLNSPSSRIQMEGWSNSRYRWDGPSTFRREAVQPPPGKDRGWERIMTIQYRWQMMHLYTWTMIFHSIWAR